MRILNCYRRFLCYIILTALIFFCLALQAKHISAMSPPLMEVGITLRDSSLRLSFGSGYRLLDRNSVAVEAIPAGEYTFLISGGGIEIQDSSGGSRGVFNSPLYLQSHSSPADSFFEILNALYGKEYRGELKITLDGNGRQILAVNHIDLETYLRGVVPGEMPPSWGNYGGIEALKAQAVAARTYALYRQSSQRHSGYHICDAQHCQAYRGRGLESLNTDLAIKETRGEILTYNGTVIEPVYHATNGGFTEEAQHVWFNPLPYFRSEPDPYDNPDNPLGISNMVVHSHAIWEADIPCEKIAGLLVSGGYANPGVIEDIIVASSFPAGGLMNCLFRKLAADFLALEGEN